MNYEEFLAKYIKTFPGKEIGFMCLFHHNVNTPAASMNRQTGAWICYACGERGSFKKLKRKLEDDLNVKIDADIPPSLDISGFTANENIVLSETVLDHYALRYHPYLKRRGITPATATYWGLRYDYATDRIAIPIRWPDGSLAGVQGRAIKNQKPKYLFLERCNKSHLLYGLDKCREFNEAIVVEGSMAVMLLTQNGVKNVVATLGSSVSAEQVALLNNFNRVYLFLDRDPAGLDGIKALTKQLESRVFVPPDFEEIDVLTKEEVEALCVAATPPSLDLTVSLR